MRRVMIRQYAISGDYVEIADDESIIGVVEHAIGRVTQLRVITARLIDPQRPPSQKPPVFDPSGFQPIPQ